MNYYYDLPQDLINHIENMVDEMYYGEFELWSARMMMLNKVFMNAMKNNHHREIFDNGGGIADVKKTRLRAARYPCNISCFGKRWYEMFIPRYDELVTDNPRWSVIKRCKDLKNQRDDLIRLGLY